MHGTEWKAIAPQPATALSGWAVPPRTEQQAAAAAAASSIGGRRLARCAPTSRPAPDPGWVGFAEEGRTTVGVPVPHRQRCSRVPCPTVTAEVSRYLVTRCPCPSWKPLSHVRPPLPPPRPLSLRVLQHAPFDPGWMAPAGAHAGVVVVFFGQSDDAERRRGELCSNVSWKGGVV